MKKLLSMALVACLGIAAPAAASLINFEYTVTPDATGPGPTTYTYDFQFWVDVTDPAYVETLGINEIRVNIAEILRPAVQGPRPFGLGFITDVQSGFSAVDFTGLPNGTAIRPDGPGFVFWRPTAADPAVRFTGVSTLLQDVTWNYFGRLDVDVSTSIIRGAGAQGRLTSPPVAELTSFNTPAPIPLPAGLPLLLAGLGGLALMRRRAA